MGCKQDNGYLRYGVWLQAQTANSLNESHFFCLLAIQAISLADEVKCIICVDKNKQTGLKHALFFRYRLMSGGGVCKIQLELF